MTIKFPCPYCGTVNGLYGLDLHDLRKPHVILCDVDIGGCDHLFVVTFEVNVLTNTHRVEVPED